MKKRRQHYVWQHYLRAWAENDQIACLRNGHVFRTNTKNIAVETDFYRLEDLDAADIQFAIDLCTRNSPPALLRAQLMLTTMFVGASRIRQELRTTRNVDPAKAAEIEETLHNFEEEIHSKLESAALPHLDAARKRDPAFLSSDGDWETFLHFCGAQWLRTKKIASPALQVGTGRGGSRVIPPQQRNTMAMRASAL